MGNNTLESCQNMSGLAAGGGLMQILARHLDTLCTYKDDTLHCTEIYHSINYLRNFLSYGHLVTLSFGHLVIQSFGHLVIRSSGH